MCIRDRFSSLALLFLIAFYSACETEFIPENINSEPELVVEGYIELGEDALPPYVILTRSRPFFNTIDSNQLNNIFVRGAEVIVSNNGQSVRLTEFCLNDLPLLVRKQVADQLGPVSYTHLDVYKRQLSSHAQPSR